MILEKSQTFKELQEDMNYYPMKFDIPCHLGWPTVGKYIGVVDFITMGNVENENNLWQKRRIYGDEVELENTLFR